ncbi:hypothetical protein EI94DRAFT_1651498, partial [Lactarius quietus]
KWPGCGKGFSQHKDCKHHERLHWNHRRFSCDGCRKPFSRAEGLCASFFPHAFFLCGSDRIFLFSALRACLRLSVRRLESQIVAGPFASVNLTSFVLIYHLCWTLYNIFLMTLVCVGLSVPQSPVICNLVSFPSLISLTFLFSLLSQFSLSWTSVSTSVQLDRRRQMPWRAVFTTCRANVNKQLIIVFLIPKLTNRRDFLLQNVMHDA